MVDTLISSAKEALRISIDETSIRKKVSASESETSPTSSALWSLMMEHSTSRWNASWFSETLRIKEACVILMPVVASR